MEMHVQDAIQWFQKTNEKIQQNKDYLTSLDQPIGDGDHGINMARGFQEVEKKLKGAEYTVVSDVLKDVAMTLMSKVGGASGPLFGTAFLKMSMATKGAATIDIATLAKGLEAATEGIKQRGKATEQEKTMIDVWSPVAYHVKEATSIQSEVLKEVAKQAMDNTKDMMATKGRGAYFKEKSIGHIDAGAASTYYIFEALAETLKN
ncbi:dihydroxyacetone kinase subunit DhaL [Pontibacillus litoralis]|uniref:phosphoenolpyruvate--glycerone phosphotransferase n=1 Tax=Pontibacillus litoralis JSM 072002 TaxID=1385512 RepID=A0A0A5G8Z7_9BACI|nr:dihydroxyacetone kinase subunit DhaL [Pontibacillus litoralis]KGX87580.1 dihydroxyacetone kinase [Pontibacillus litoralis JSM 072002]